MRSRLGSAPSTLDPAGPSAGLIADLYSWMFWAGSAVYVLVLLLMLAALLRGSRRREPRQSRFARPLVLALGIGLPVAVLVPLSVGTLLVGRSLERTPGSESLVVEVIGKQFWWEIRYPALGVVTANEIHVPVGQPVTYRVLSDDVIHSFWVPQVAGKLDMIPGQENAYTFVTEEPAVYEGFCAEYCGIQHARMRFQLIAEPPEEFADWVGEQQELLPRRLSPLAQDGLEVFRTVGCASCHRVAGVSDGQVGPDLTHLASRRTLGAGLLENNRGNLAGWIIDPQGIKPGNRMPGTDLTGPQLQALLAYLQELE